MHTDVRLRGGKKFSHLLLIQPDFPVFGIKCHRCPSVSSPKDDDILFVVHNHICLMGLQPVVAKARIGYEWHIEGEGVLHFFKDDGLYPTLFFRIDREVEFVVYL